MSVNRGKEFEDLIKSQIAQVDETFIYRLYDTTFGFSGVTNICDFFVFKQPTLYAIECKTTNQGTLNFSYIRDNQHNGLLEASKTKGINAGYLIWFVHHDITVFVPVAVAEELKQSGKKSIPKDIINHPECTQISGKKKRVFFDYDFNEFFGG